MEQRPEHRLRLDRLPAAGARMLAALGITAFIGWYAVDLALTRGSATVEFAAWSWVASLGWVVVVFGVLGVAGDLGDRWHAPRPFERRGDLYRRLGVPVAKRFMPNGDYAVRLQRRFRPGYRLIRDARSAADWERHTRSKETGHLVHLLTTLPLAVFLAAQGAAAPLLTVALLDVAFDSYPVLVQRWNRVRLERVLAHERWAAAHPAAG